MQLFEAILAARDCHVAEMEIVADHVCILTSISASYSIGQVVGAVKNISASMK